MKKTYFISAQDLKDYTPTNDNVDDKRLLMSIYDCQETFIQQTLGTKLYNKLKEMVEEKKLNGTPLPENYRILLDEYIVPTLIRYSLAEIIPFISFKIENKGLSTMNGDNSVPVAIEELKYFIKINKDKAEFYNQRLINYLITNMTLFTEYSQITNFDEMIPNQKAYKCELYLEDTYIDPSIWFTGNKDERQRFL